MTSSVPGDRSAGPGAAAARGPVHGDDDLAHYRDILARMAVPYHLADGNRPEVTVLPPDHHVSGGRPRVDRARPGAVRYGPRHGHPAARRHTRGRLDERHRDGRQCDADGARVVRAELPWRTHRLAFRPGAGRVLLAHRQGAEPQPDVHSPGEQRRVDRALQSSGRATSRSRSSGTSSCVWASSARCSARSSSAAC